MSERCTKCGAQVCSECGMAINHYRLYSGLCKSCFCRRNNKDPVVIAKMQATKAAKKEAKRRELDDLGRRLA